MQPPERPTAALEVGYASLIQAFPSDAHLLKLSGLLYTVRDNWHQKDGQLLLNQPITGFYGRVGLGRSINQTLSCICEIWERMMPRWSCPKFGIAVGCPVTTHPKKLGCSSSI